MSETNNPLNRYYNRIQSLVTRIPANLRSIDISWIRLRRDASSSSSSSRAEDSSPVHQNRSDVTVDTRPPTRRESATQSLFGSATSSLTTSPIQSPTTTNGQPLSRPPHSHLYRHSSHYPLLLGSYNNWSSNRDHRFISHSNAITNADKERNVLSAIMSIVVIATLATALAQPKWFSINGGVCTRRYIGLQEFFYVGNFNNYHFTANKVKTGNVFDTKPIETDTKEVKTHLTTEEILLYGLNADLKNCVTPEIVTLQRTIIGLCFFAIMFNLIQFFFDTLGVHTKWLNAVRSHALGNILSVLLCVVIVGVSYLVSDLLEKEQRRLLKQNVKTPSEGHHVEVKFELSYYLVTFSGLLAIIAAASNLLRRPQHFYIDATDSFWTDDIDEELNSSATASPNWQSLNTNRSPGGLFLPPPPPPPHPSVSLPPPPPYSP